MGTRNVLRAGSATVAFTFLALATIVTAAPSGSVQAQAGVPPAPDWLAFTTRTGKSDDGLDCARTLTAAGRAGLAVDHGSAYVQQFPERPAFAVAELGGPNADVVSVAGTQWVRLKAGRGTITRVALDVPQGELLDYLAMLYPEQVSAGARAGLEIRNATRAYGTGALGADGGTRQGAWLETETDVTLRGRPGSVSPVTARIVLSPPIEGYRHATDGDLAPGSDRFAYSDLDYGFIDPDAGRMGRRAFDPSPWRIGLIVDASGADREASALFAWVAPWRHDPCAASDAIWALGSQPTAATPTPARSPIPVTPSAGVATPRTAQPPTTPPPTAVPSTPPTAAPPTVVPATPTRSATPVAPSQPSQGGYTVTSGFVTRQVGFECQSQPQTQISAAALGPLDGVGLVLGTVLGPGGSAMQDEVRILTIGPNGQQVWENRGASPPHCFRVLGRYPGGTIATGAFRADVYVGATLIKTYTFTVTP